MKYSLSRNGGRGPDGIAGVEDGESPPHKPQAVAFVGRSAGKMRALTQLLRAGRISWVEGTCHTTRHVAGTSLPTRGLDDFFDNVEGKEEEVIVGACEGRARRRNAAARRDAGG